MGTLYIVSTPIGNLEDITIRALHTLFSVDAIACEDTRVTGNLWELLKNKYNDLISVTHKPILIPYHNNNEQTITPELIQLLKQGKNIALVSDAGTPLVSDPGYRIVTEVQKQNIPIIVVPGVSAFLTALTGSGLQTNTWTFLGYLPEKQSRRITKLRNMKKSSVMLSSTYICYVAPHKFIQTMKDIHLSLGDIPCVIGRELTKIHEEYWKGTPQEAFGHFSHPKGEFVLLFTL